LGGTIVFRHFVEPRPAVAATSVDMKACKLDRLAALTIFGSFLVISSLVIPAAALAADDAARHPEPGAISAPAGVPASYVFTHHGWFHPSCVVRIREDEVVGADQVVRGRADGAAHLSLSPCAYPRFDLHGHAAPAGLPPQAASAAYDGYIVYYVYNGSVPNAPTLVNDLIVPPAPTDVADQDIAFFNGILTATAIMQPVIDFNGETANKWSVESEQCCIDGNDLQTTPVVVAVGDTIRGTVTGSGCSSAGVCSNWAITTADSTTGKSTTLNTTVVNEAPNGITPASLETYGVTSCAMFPAGGESTFTETSLTDSQGNVDTPKYQLLVMQDVDAEVPRTCGQAGKSSGNDFTVIYGPVAGGTGGTGGGAGGMGGAKGTGGSTGGAGAKGTGGSTGGGGAKGTGGGTGGGGSSGSAGAKGTGGLSGTGGAGGAKGTGGATVVTGTGGSGTGNTGTGGTPGTGGATVVTGTGGSGTGSSGTGGTLGTGGATVVTGTGGSPAGTGGSSAVSTGGSSGAAGRAGGTGGATTGSSDTNNGSPSSGCSCDTTGNSTPSFSLMFVFMAAAIWSRRRRRS
jgi:MYXO-CTERM domain-containing protein